MRYVLAALALALATGCGAGDRGPAVAEAVDKTEAAGSSLIAVDATGSDGRITCEGAADYVSERLRLTCDSAAGGYAFIAIGDTTYMRGDLLGIASGGDRWLKYRDDASIGSMFSPRELLRLLRSASEETRRVGEEEVRGVETVRYRLEVNCERAEFFDCAGATAPVEVWIGDDGLVRRIGIREESNAGTIDFHDFGARVDVNAPPAEEVEDLYASGGRERCSEAHGEPVSVRQALAALRGSGFDAPEPYCMASVAVLAATNAPGDRAIVSCLLAAEPSEDAPTRTRRRGAAGNAVSLELQNLTCTIHADGPSRRQATDRLDAAFAELE